MCVKMHVQDISRQWGRDVSSTEQCQEPLRVSSYAKHASGDVCPVSLMDEMKQQWHNGFLFRRFEVFVCGARLAE